MTLVFLDTETTGLDPAKDQIWEIAYAINHGPVYSTVVPHSITPPPEVAEINGYYGRGDSLNLVQSELLVAGLREALDGATLVGANPSFDAGFLRARWGETPWHYRMLDVESYAMGALGWDSPKGLKDVYAALVELGYELPAPNHTAAGDVATTQAAYYALRQHYEALRFTG